MKEIKSLNYDIIAPTAFSYWFLRFSSKNFRGSTSILYFFCHIFFRKSYLLNINGTKSIWPINSKSDFRLLRGDYNGETGKYSLEIGYEGIDIAYIKTLIREGDFIIDIGANKGFYTLFLASYVKENGKVISIEASKKNFSNLFSRITKLWNLTNVLPLNFILGDSNFERVNLKKPSFFDDGTGFYFSRSIKNNAPYSRTLDNLLNPINFESFKLIKIDVEGAEVIVLNGAKKILEKTEFVLVEVSNTGEKRFDSTVTELYDLLNSVGFLFAYTVSLSNNHQPIISPASNLQVGNILFSKRDLN